MPSHPSKINNRIWITRVKRGLARKKLAALLGQKTTSQLCRWEDGSQLPSLENALALGYLLQTPVEFLFGRLRDSVVRQVEARRSSQEDEPMGEEVFAAMPAAPKRYERRVY